MGSGSKLSEGEIQGLLSRYLREKNREAVSALKMVKTRIATEKGRLSNVNELGEEDLLRIVKKEVKEIQDTIASLRKAGREDRIPEEERKKAALEALLPAALSDEEIEKIIEQVVRETGTKDFGRVMKGVMAKVAGRADGKRVSELVRKAMASRDDE